jgi:RNA polymerase sigma-70 factor (ECF subfamily)
MSQNSLGITAAAPASVGKVGGTTSPTLLGRAADWHDLSAWHDMFGRYQPLLRHWCRGFGLDDAAIEDVCQRVWVELADRISSFRYDPARTFRGWLRELCRSRAIDLIRQRQRERRSLRLLDDDLAAESPLACELPDSSDEEECDPDHRHALMLREAENAQVAVRKRLEPKTWEAYWAIGIEGQTVREAATALGMSYAAAFAAYTRVHRKLRDEGMRRLPALLKS